MSCNRTIRMRQIATILSIAGVWVGATIVTKGAPAPLTFISDSIVDDKALVTPTGPTFGGVMNGLSIQNDILVSHNGWQYTAWYDTVGTDESVWLARRQILGIETGEWEKFDTGSDLLNGDEPKWDSHNTISIGISRKDGRVHMSWDHHGHDLRYRYSMPGQATYDDSVWNAGRFVAEQNWLTSPSNKLSSITYPMFIRTPDDSLLFSHRTGGSNNGYNWITKMSTTGVNHPSPILVTVKEGTYTGPAFNSTNNFTSTSRNAYANGFDYGPDGKLHYTWTWRESVVASNHDICYAYSPDHGVTWYNNAGTLIANTALGQTIRVDTPGIVVVPLDGRQQLINQQAQTVDDQGRVHVLMRHRRQEPGYEWVLGDGAFSGPKTAYFHYVRDPATGTWTGMRLPVTYATGSRPDVETLANGDVYTVFRSGGSLIVAGATAASSYTDWEIVANYGTVFGGDPRIDHDRLRKSGVLSVFLSESAPAATPDAPSQVPLHVIDFATGPVFEAHAGQDQRVTAQPFVQTATVTLTGEVGLDGQTAVQSVRWLHDQQVVSNNDQCTVSLPVGTHQLVFEATSTQNDISEDIVIVEVLEAPTVPPATIYETSFNAGLGSPIANYGWSAYSNTGTDLSLSTADPLYVFNNTNVFIGSGGANQGGRYAMISAAAPINPADYQNDLSISFKQNATDEVAANPDMGWRVFARVGSDIYVSNFNPFTASATTIEVKVAHAVWSLWTGETNLADGFDVTAISAVTSILPSGALSEIGILALDGSSGNDRMRLFDFTIRGTAIVPPPFDFKIAPATPPATGYDLEWRSRPGKLYNLRTSTDLANPIAEWDLIEGNIPANPPANVKNVPEDGPRRFYAVQEFDAP